MCSLPSISQLISRQPTSVSEELAMRENSTPYREIRTSTTMPPPQLPRLPAPALPHQTSQGSSTRSIPPSPSLTSPPNHSSRPTWPGQRSRVSSTLHSHSHSANQSQQPRSARPSTETTGQANTFTPVPPSPATERQHSANGTQPQLPIRTPKLPARAITAQCRPHRYCQPCGINKPPRAHHCKTCDTVRFCLSRDIWMKRAHEGDLCVPVL